ncbi:MAG: hypothetical protein NC240_10525 [Clostridium sp.]|nr:hypothetical protein [Clostridium sp.]
MKKRVFLGVVFLALFFVSAFSIISYAREKSLDRDYGGLTLTCYIKCTSTRGEGSTSGANIKGYKNYIKVATYDINQNSLGYSEVYSTTDASTSVTKGSPYLTKTFHAAAYVDGNIQCLPIYQQIQLTECRD